jgi:Ni/Co efflux regulator RcnB
MGEPVTRILMESVVKTIILAASLVAVIGVSPAFAQGMPYPSAGTPQSQQNQHMPDKSQGKVGGPGAGERHGPAPHMAGKPQHGQPQMSGNEAGKLGGKGQYGRPGDHNSQWAKGNRLPSNYRHDVVTDYGRYRLPPPRHGSQWVRVGNEYLLVNLASGVILSMVSAY